MGERPLTGEVEVDLLVGPGRGEVGRGADGGGATADHGDRPRGGELVVSGPEAGLDLGERLEVGAAPEAVGDAGRDHQGVVRLGGRGSIGETYVDRAGLQVEAGERAVDRADVVEAAVAVEADEVVALPVLGAGQPGAELLAADQRGLAGDADEVGVPGEMDRRQQAAVAEAGDDDTWLSLAPQPTRLGGRGTSIGTRSITSW